MKLKTIRVSIDRIPESYGQVTALPLVVSDQRSAVSGQSSAVSGQRSVVSGQRSAVSGQSSAYFIQKLNAHACA
ncbi:hypothetical protein [Moorena sp. SIO4G3]|uniref:hypothetical protein n=1 Tax=Moorena sp. SIO4G3 TaxID=2607821 RepID=UPI00142B854F|nr:hypothetical protein [Moorena sp. SIO4G3]NEO79744.1 hypothetical protein [Moorena sp. SIO4G3]